MYWADTGTRGGLGRAFRNSILAKRCDVFLGLSDNGDDDLLPKKLVFTEPYISLGYVLVVQGKAEGMKSLDELKQNKLKVGVPMSTPIDDYLFTNNIPRELYLDNRRIMEGMAKGEVDASMVWATAIAVAKHEFPDAKFHMVEGYVPVDGQRFNMKFRRAQGRQDPAGLRQRGHQGPARPMARCKRSWRATACPSMRRFLRKQYQGGRKKMLRFVSASFARLLRLRWWP